MRLGKHVTVPTEFIMDRNRSRDIAFVGATNQNVLLDSLTYCQIKVERPFDLEKSVVFKSRSLDTGLRVVGYHGDVDDEKSMLKDWAKTEIYFASDRLLNHKTSTPDGTTESPFLQREQSTTQPGRMKSESSHF